MPIEVQPWWVTPLVTLVVALIGVGGTWLTMTVTKRNLERQRAIDAEAKHRRREETLQRRVFKLINYAQRLRDAHYRGDPPPPEAWPEDLYDQHED